jgi:hypothetical protein
VRPAWLDERDPGRVPVLLCPAPSGERAPAPTSATTERASVYVDFTPQQKALRAELREYFDAPMTAEVRAGLTSLEGGTKFRKIVEMDGR